MNELRKGSCKLDGVFLCCPFPTRCLGWNLELSWVSFWGFPIYLLPTQCSLQLVKQIFLLIAKQRQWRHVVTDVQTDCRGPWFIFMSFKVAWRRVAQFCYWNVNYITFQLLGIGFSTNSLNVNISFWIPIFKPRTLIITLYHPNFKGLNGKFCRCPAYGFIKPSCSLSNIFLCSAHATATYHWTSF